MSRSVTFTFSPSISKPPTQSAPATKHTPTTSTTRTVATTTTTTTTVPDDKTQLTPQVKKVPQPTEAVLTGAGFHHKTGKQIPSSVQAETGQLKMDNRDVATSFTSSSYRLKSIYQKGQSPAVNAHTIAEKMRQQSNNSVHEHVRNVKYELASLHEHLLKLEDEIKLANKGKNAIEKAIQDIRRGISVNQQSISALQKKRREEVFILMITCINSLLSFKDSSKSEVFLEEARTLSSTKRKLEIQFHVIKQQLHSLDGIRKQLQNKISTLSKLSELDAQRFKVGS